MTESRFCRVSLAHQMGNLGDKMLLIFSEIQSHLLESEVLGVLPCFDEIQFNHKGSWNQAKYTLLVTMTFPLVSFNSDTLLPCLVFCPSPGGHQLGVSLDLSDWHSYSHVLFFLFCLCNVWL